MAYRYRQIYDDLLYKIKTGVYPGGTLLPSSEELERLYGTSPITVKRALTELKDHGYILRIKHKGSLVVEQIDTPSHKHAAEPDTPFVAVVFSYYDDHGTRVINGLKNAAFAKNIRLAFFDSGNSVAREREILKKLRSERLSGLILTPVHPAYNADVVSEFYVHGTPISFMDRPVHGIRKPCVHSDNFSGMYDVVVYLLTCGHKRIGFLGIDDMICTEQERYNGYCHALLQNSVPINRDYVYTIRRDGGLLDGADQLDAKCRQNALDAVDYFSSLSHRPTAIVCLNDYMAIHIIHALQQRGLSVPADFAVTGFDNTDAARKLGLTTVAQDFAQIARQALEAVLHQQHSQLVPPPRDIQINSILMKRDSVTELTIPF